MLIFNDFVCRYMTASPFGDIFDVIQQPVGSEDLLGLYRVLWLVGDVVLSEADVATLLKYVSLSLPLSLSLSLSFFLSF